MSKQDGAAPFRCVEMPHYLMRQDERLRVLAYFEDHLDDIARETGIRRELVKDTLKHLRSAVENY